MDPGIDNPRVKWCIYAKFHVSFFKALYVLSLSLQGQIQDFGRGSNISNVLYIKKTTIIFLIFFLLAFLAVLNVTKYQ